VTGRQGRRRRKLLDDLKEGRGYSHLKEEARDRTMWRAGFGRGFGPVVRQTTKWMNSECVSVACYPASKAHAPCHRWPVYLYHILPHYLINGMIKKIIIDRKMCVLIFCTALLWNISHSKKNRARRFRKRVQVKWPLLVSDFNEPVILWIDFSKSTQIQNFMKIRPVEASLLHAGGQTDMTKLIVAFRNYDRA